MTRYIDLDIAIKAVTMAVHDQFTAVDVVTALKEAPAADVAPRAEVEGLQSQVNRLKKYDEERDIALHSKLIADTRQKVAREIINDFVKIAKEKIEQKDGHIEEHYGLRSYWENKYFYDGEVEDIIDEVEAELKKKYSEKQK